MRTLAAEFRDAIDALQGAGDIQFKRIAQMQADIDSIKQMLQRRKLPRRANQAELRGEG